MRRGAEAGATYFFRWGRFDFHFLGPLLDWTCCEGIVYATCGATLAEHRWKGVEFAGANSDGLVNSSVPFSLTPSLSLGGEGATTAVLEDPIPFTVRAPSCFGGAAREPFMRQEQIGSSGSLVIKMKFLCFVRVRGWHSRGPGERGGRQADSAIQVSRCDAKLFTESFIRGLKSTVTIGVSLGDKSDPGRSTPGYRNSALPKEQSC